MTPNAPHVFSAWGRPRHLACIGLLSVCSFVQAGGPPDAQCTDRGSLNGTTCTFSVTNVADSGIGSLRQALLDANAWGAFAGVVSGDSIVAIDAALGGQTLSLQTALPALISSIAVEGPATALQIDGVGIHRCLMLTGLPLFNPMIGPTASNHPDGLPQAINVQLARLALNNCAAFGGNGAQGLGDGNGGGGGGLGAGAAILVNQQTNLTLIDVSFSANRVRGGQTLPVIGGNGGGGLGGNGTAATGGGGIAGSGGAAGGGGFGGAGASQAGSSGGGGFGAAGAGQIDERIALVAASGGGGANAGGGGNNGDAGHLSGAGGLSAFGGGAGGIGTDGGVGGGGGSVDASGIGGRGGFGGGGGRGSIAGGAGGYGGGGGGADEVGGAGGAGGFGGGGGGGNSTGPGGLGGFGAGAGGGDIAGLPGFGGAATSDCGVGTPCPGAGAGFGAGVFVQAPATLRVQGSLSLSGGSAEGGGTNPAANAGGAGAFLAGDGELELSPAGGLTQLYADAIADQRGLWSALAISGPQHYPSGGVFAPASFPNAWQYSNDGRWSLRKLGAGSVLLTADNAYSGGTEVIAGELRPASVAALGIGNVSNSASLRLTTPLQLQIGDPAPGSLTANFTQTASGTLRVGFGGASCVLDRLQVRDVATLNGELGIDASGCKPALSSVHRLIDAAQRQGQFSNAAGSEFTSGGNRYAISYQPDGVDITVLGPDDSLFADGFE